jgi:hypothetical protein
MKTVHVLVAVVSALVVGTVTVAAPRIDIPGITRVRDEGTPVTYRPNLNFTGSGVTCTDDAVNNETDCAISSTGGSGYDQIQDEGSNLTQRTTLDFVGSGVTCTDTGSKTQCSIPGGAGTVPDGGTQRLVVLGDRSYVGTSSTGFELTELRYDAGVIGGNFTFECHLTMSADGGTVNGIRINTDSLSLTATTQRHTSMLYCSSATAAAVIGGALNAASADYQPTASQGNVPCEHVFTRHVRDVTAGGQVRVFMYSELGGVNGTNTHAGSYCTINHW